MNPLKKHLEALFRECTGLDANLRVQDAAITLYREISRSAYPSPDLELITMISIYRDLSQLEGGANLYNTNIDYALTMANLDTEMDRLLSYTACLAVTQFFEVFESFLKNILAEVIVHNTGLSSKLRLTKNDGTFAKVREAIRLIQGTGNKGFFKALRKISPYFRKHETGNIWEMNMSHWFDLIAQIRNLIIHSRLAFTPDFEKYIKESHRKALFNKHFTVEYVDRKKRVALTPQEAHHILSQLFGLAHLIYKSLSLDHRLETDFDFEFVSLK